VRPAIASRKSGTSIIWSTQGKPNLLVARFAKSRAMMCRDVDLLRLAFAGLKRHRSGAAIDIVGIITTRAMADTVIDSNDD